MPKWFGGSRDEACQMNMLQANNHMAIMNGILFLYGLIFIICYWAQRCSGRHPSVIAEWIQIATLVYVLLMVLTLLIYSTVWFISVQFMWDDYSKECIDGWNQLDFANFVVLLFIAGITTALTALLSCILCCFLPAICQGIRQHRDNE